MTIIDAHVHLWDAARGHDILVMRRNPGLRRLATPDDLAARLDAAGIDRAVVVQAAPQEAETRWLLGLAAAAPRVAGVVGWVDLRGRDVAGALAGLRTAHLAGVRGMLHRVDDPGWIADPTTAPGLAALAASGLALDVTATPAHLDACRRAFAAMPGLRVVVDHGATPPIARRGFDDWAPGIAALARDTGVLCKLSGLVEEAAPAWTLDDLLPYARHLVDCFGPARLIAGSNWPVVELAGGHARWWRTLRDLLDRLGLSPAERAAVLGGNAAAFYRLETP
jgi:L-fuconolactonase